VPGANRTNIFVHYAMIVALGCGLFPAFVRLIAEPVITAAGVRQFMLAFVWITGIAMALTVVNLALRGLGAPFAIRLSSRLATDWMYASTRNPMLFCTLLWFFAMGLWHRSAWFLLWLALSVAPGWIWFIRIYEERELEIRFGAPYREYRRNTPFLLPRFGHAGMLHAPTARS
jgi:protein-S-isoprenylcysteine O-methyltransferase Ste14